MSATSTAPASACDHVLGAGAAAHGAPLLALALAARHGVGLGDGAELLLDGAQVGHQGVQVDRVALVQRLCKGVERSRGRRLNGQALRRNCVQVVALARSLTIYVVHGEAVGEVGHVGLLAERRLLQGLLGPAVIQTLHNETHNQYDVTASTGSKQL